MDAKDLSVVISKTAVFSRLDDTSGVVLELKRKRYYMLSETGVAIMEMLHDDSPVTVQEIVESLLGDFDLDRETLGRDVQHYLRELQRRRVIEFCSSAEQLAEPDPSDSAETAEFLLDTAELHRSL